MLLRLVIKTLITFSVCMVLLMQNALAIGLSAYSMNKAHEQVDGGLSDIELICTGKTMRYVSVSASELAGEFVFVSPELVNTPPQNIDCTNGTLADLPSYTSVKYDLQVSVLFQRFYALTESLVQRPYTAYPYAAPIGRAPPLS